MSLPTFTSNYTNRAVDIYLLEVPKPTFKGQARLKFPEKVKITTGIQKLAQMYVITLFTALGSDTINPNKGTAVGDFLLGGISPIEEEIQHIINIGNSEAVDLILEDQEDIIDQGLEVVPEDEQLVNATVLDLRIPDRSRVEFDVQLNTVAGESRVFVVPVALPIT